MKSRTQFTIIVCLLLVMLAITWYSLPGQKQEPEQITSAVVNRDCAPWDGAAFVISIPTEAGGMLEVSIWQAPDITHPVTLPFDNHSMQTGFAVFHPQDGILEQLTGEVWLLSAEDGKPVEGRFHLHSEQGREFEGRFVAAWGTRLALCG